jgi:hypothetical protein
MITIHSTAMTAMRTSPMSVIRWALQSQQSPSSAGSDDLPYSQQDGQRGDVVSGGSYEPTNDPRVHFGLGTSTVIDSVEVHWPSGVTERFTVPKVGRIVTLIEGKGENF